MQIVNTIAGLLQNNIDTLNLPTILKSVLKKLKSLFIQNKEKEESNPGEPETENGENSVQTEEASQTSGDGGKEQR